MSESAEDKGVQWPELMMLVLLSSTAILTAWCGFQSSKWGGAMAISFSQASAGRIEAARLDGAAGRKMSIQVGLFTQWLDAKHRGADDLADFIAVRFPEPLAAAFQSWLLTDPLHSRDAPTSPFDQPEYVLPDAKAAQQADERADAKFQEALANNQRGDNYTILTVLYAMVLFFAALAGRVQAKSAQWAMRGVAITGFLIATAILISYPRLL